MIFIQRHFFVLCIILLSNLATLISSRLEAAPFRVGIYEMPPHMCDENEVPRGAAVEYFKIIAGRMGLSDYVFEGYPLSRLLKNLEEGKLDMALFLAKNSERAAKLKYSSKPFFELVPSLAVTSGSSLETASSLKNINNLKVGTLQRGYLPALLKQPNIEIEALSGIDAPMMNLKKLLAKRVDAVFLPKSTIRFEIEQLNQVDRFKILNITSQVLPVYAVFPKSTDPKFIEKYEKSILEGDSEIYQSLVDSFIASAPHHK